MITCVIFHFDLDGTNIETEDMIDFYNAFFTDVFDVEIDDGSVDKMADITCALYKEIRNDQRELYDEVLAYGHQLANQSLGQVQFEDRTNVLAGEDFIDGHEDEDDQEEGVIECCDSHDCQHTHDEHETDNAILQEPEDNNKVDEIEEDGWTTVKPKNRRK